MMGLTDFITEANWKDIFTIWFVLIDDAYQALERQHGGWRRRGPKPAFSDSEVVTVALVIDTFFHGHEALGLAFLRQYHLDMFPKLLPNGAFNERRRALRLIIEQIRQDITRTWGLIDKDDSLRLMDSAPIPLCTYMRASRNQTLTGAEYCSVMQSKRAKLFGLRLYVTTTDSQVVDQWMLAPAAPRDSKVMTALLEDTSNLHVFADGAYQDPTEMAYLQRRRNVHIWALPRKDAREPWPEAFRRWVKRLRLRVETVFSSLVTVFDIERPGSRSLSGLIARTATRLLAYNLCFITTFLLKQMSSITPN